MICLYASCLWWDYVWWRWFCNRKVTFLLQCLGPFWQTVSNAYFQIQLILLSISWFCATKLTDKFILLAHPFLSVEYTFPGSSTANQCVVSLLKCLKVDNIIHYLYPAVALHVRRRMLSIIMYHIISHTCWHRELYVFLFDSNDSRLGGSVCVFRAYPAFWRCRLFVSLNYHSDRVECA